MDSLTELIFSEMFVRMSFEIFGASLVEMVNDPSQFQLLQVSRTEEGGEPLLFLEARYHGPAGQNRWQDQVYWAKLMSEEPYLIVESGIRSKPLEQLIRLEYQDDTRFARFPKVVTRMIGALDTQVFSFEVPTHCQLDSKEFYLPHYGISETVLETLQPSPWFRRSVSLIGLLVLIPLGMWLYRRSRVSSTGQ